MLTPGLKSEKSVPSNTTAETRGLSPIGQTSVNSDRAEQQQRDSSSPPYDVSSGPQVQNHMSTTPVQNEKHLCWRIRHAYFAGWGFYRSTGPP